MSLEINNLTVGYGSRQILSGIESTLRKAALTVLIGANGSGKSTLLRTLAGTQRPLEGDIMLDGKSIYTWTSSKLARHISIVCPDRTGGGGLRVNELVAIGRHPYSGFFGQLSDADREVIAGAIHTVGLDDKTDNYVTQLSDGERQKAMIARAIAQETEIIILDEPTSFLDVSSRFDIMKRLVALAHQHGKTILLSTHDTAAALPLADNVWAIADGCLYCGSLGSLAETGIMNKVFPGVEYDTVRLDYRPVI